MNNKPQEPIKLRTNKAERPKEIVLMQHIDRIFTFPLWIPLAGLIFGLIGEAILIFKKK